METGRWSVTFESMEKEIMLKFLDLLLSVSEHQTIQHEKIVACENKEYEKASKLRDLEKEALAKVPRHSEIKELRERLKNLQP